jgi:hypothetical protein
VADPPPHLSRLAHGVEAEHPRRTGRGQQERRQDLDRRRLAGAVRAEQAEQLAALDVEADA